MTGTLAVEAKPHFADGRLSGCLMEFSAIARDLAYRQGGFIKVVGSFGLMEQGGYVAPTLKVVVHDIDVPSMALTPAPPSRAFFVENTRSTAGSVIASYPSNTPGAIFVVFQ